jgi:hypothetical protein
MCASGVGATASRSSAADSRRSWLSTVGNTFDAGRSFPDGWPDPADPFATLTGFVASGSPISSVGFPGLTNRLVAACCPCSEQPLTTAHPSSQRPQAGLTRQTTGVLVLAGFAVEPRLATQYVQHDEHGEHDEPGSS